MHVVVDGIAFESGRLHGICRYHREILSRIGRTERVDVWLRRPPRAQMPEHCHVMSPAPWRWVMRRGRLRRAFGGWVRPSRKNMTGVFHSTFFTMAPYTDMPQVVTVHDMIPERFPDACFWPGVGEHVAIKRRVIEAARVCIAVSWATAKEVKAFYPRVADKIVVIHHGSDHFTSNENSRSHNCRGIDFTKGYALFVGDRYSYKNFRTVLEAMARSAWPRSMHLRIVGVPFTDLEERLITRLGVKSYVDYAGVLSDAELGHCYEQAMCLISPSLSEGFGFPVLEAQRRGCPVVCSDIEVYRETAGRGAVWFDPRLAESLADAVGVAVQPDARDRLIHEGYRNADPFTWDRCAAGTLAVYRQAVGEHGGV